MSIIKKIFAPEKFLSKGSKKGFESWCFKCDLRGKSFAFNVGICHDEGNRHSFIQYIDTLRCENICFDYQDFNFNKATGEVMVGGNCFSKNGLSVKLSGNDFQLFCALEFSGHSNYKKPLFSCPCLGPCNHYILSLNAVATGQIDVNGFKLGGMGNAYICKDLGTSFYEEYVWVHTSGSCTDSHGNQSPFSLSLACNNTQPHKHICVLQAGGKIHNLSSYNLELGIYGDTINQNASILLFKGNNSLELNMGFNKISSKMLTPPCSSLSNVKILKNLAAKAHLRFNLGDKPVDLNALASIKIVAKNR